ASLSATTSSAQNQNHDYRARSPRRADHEGVAGYRARLGAYAAGFEGGDLIRACLRWLVIPPGTGGGAEYAAELRRGSEAHRRLRGRGDGHDRAIAGQWATVRDAGHRAEG